MAKERLFFVGVKAMINDAAGRILLLDSGDYHQKHQQRHWDFPGGRIDVGEDPKTALTRELLEETGIVDFSEPEFFTAVRSNHQIKLDDGSMAGLVLMVYKTDLTSKQKITLSEEHSNFGWVDMKTASERLADKYPPEFTDLL